MRTTCPPSRPRDGVLPAPPQGRDGTECRAAQCLSRSPVAAILGAAALNDDLVHGVQAGQAARAGQGVQDVVFVGREVHHRAGASFRCCRASRRAKRHSARVLADDQDVVLARLDEGDNDPFLIRLEDFLVHRVGLNDAASRRRRQLRPRTGTGLIERQRHGPVFADRDRVAQGRWDVAQLGEVHGRRLILVPQHALDVDAQHVAGVQAVDVGRLLAEEGQGDRLLLLLRVAASNREAGGPRARRRRRGWSRPRTRHRPAHSTAAVIPREPAPPRDTRWISCLGESRCASHHPVKDESNPSSAARPAYGLGLSASFVSSGGGGALCGGGVAPDCPEERRRPAVCGGGDRGLGCSRRAAGHRGRMTAAFAIAAGSGDGGPVAETGEPVLDVPLALRAFQRRPFGRSTAGRPAARLCRRRSR